MNVKTRPWNSATADIASGLRISRKVVQRVLESHRAVRLGQPKRVVHHSRHSKLDDYDETIRKLITSYPHLTVMRLLGELQQRGFQGGYTILRERVMQLRALAQGHELPRGRT
jgi:transposase